MKVVVIDGKSVFYRGYYAMGALSTSEGVPTGGVYGFAVIALELVSSLAPDKVVVAWDKAGTSIAKRKEIFAEYKAGRVKPPEDFYAQIPLLVELVEAFGWEFLECNNYEADDIIGSLAMQAQSLGSEMVIVSSDLDMMQVVGEGVEMYRLIKGFSQLEKIDVVAVEKKYGILKSQFLDLKALKGDASDNIPGVPGIGEKTAVKLLSLYGSLEGVYENLEKIGGAVEKKLVDGRESALMSYKLAKIMTDAPVNLGKVREFRMDKVKILQVLGKLEFKSLIGKYEKWFGMSEERGVGGVAEISKKIPDGLVVEFDLKEKMHRDGQLAERVMAGEEFYDLSQGRFLLNPLERREKGLLGLIDESREKEYWRQKQEFLKYPKLEKILKEYDLPLIPVLFKMEKKGILIDLEYFKRLKEEFRAEVATVEQKIFDLAGGSFNLNSPLQLSQVLFERLGLSTKGIKKKTRAYSTGVKELEKLKNEHEVIGLIMEYREISKLLNTYIEPLVDLADKEGRIHTTFTQDVTATGRLSSVSPNLQNIPVRTETGRRIRKGFIAGKGRKLVAADYAQFELRLAGVMAGDMALVADFNAGIDIHTKTAAEVFGVEMSEVNAEQRRAAKVINFGVLYGMSPKGLAEATKMSFYEAKNFIEGYFKLRAPISIYLEQILKQAREEGYVETYYGRRRPTPDVKSANYIVRTGAERAAQNMPIQGTEADLMKRAMILLDRALPTGADLILQVHDSLVVECEEGLVEEVSNLMREIMEGVAPELKIKLAVEVKVGDSWGEL